MGMSGGYGPADDAVSIATIHAALEAGITMLDTGDFYGSGHNEMLRSANSGSRSSPTECSRAGSSATARRRHRRQARFARACRAFRPRTFRATWRSCATLGAIAREKNASTAQLAFAWVRSRGEDVVPLIGARRRDQLNEALGALEVALTPADLARIAQAVPAEAVAGTRYLPAVLAHMDSEHAG
jgi:aryl-alcohol dehydrogenase-like predicted oxidoreductase